MYYFVYHTNTIALYWEEKPTQLWMKIMNRKSPNNNRSALALTPKMENALNNDYKINDGRNFQFTKFSFTDFVLTDRRSLSGKQPKSASYKSSSCRFSFWAERNANTKATEYVTFGFSFVYWFFFPSRKVWTSLSVSDTDFFLYRELWKLCHSFINLTEWRQRRVTCQ